MKSQLALFGGQRAVTVASEEKWVRPVAREREAVCDLINRGFLSGAGKGIPLAFEEEFREFIGCKYVLTTSHGHLAIASACFAAGLGRGDEFLHPTLGGYLGSYAGALHAGATPVFCEPDEKTLLLDPRDVERRITPRTRVVIPVHRSGRVCDMDSLLAVCRQYGLTLIEDAAHAHGSEWGGIRIGNVGHAACFSLQGVDPGNKPCTAGEGGILCTNDRNLYERALLYCHLHRAGALEELSGSAYAAIDKQFLGWKWRAHPLALAIARISLESLPDRLSRFAANRDELRDRLADLRCVELAHNYPKAKGSELFGGLKLIYDSNACGGLPRERFVEALAAEGVPVTGGGYASPEHLRPLFSIDIPELWGKGHCGPADVPLPRYQRGDYPVAERVNETLITLPGWIEAADGLISQIATAFHKVAEQHGKLHVGGAGS
jgi:dTDP-4-amino-4,6-dideoxygalactose transaminase